MEMPDGRAAAERRTACQRVGRRMGPPHAPRTERSALEKALAARRDDLRNSSASLPSTRTRRPAMGFLRFTAHPAIETQ